MESLNPRLHYTDIRLECLRIAKGQTQTISSPAVLNADDLVKEAQMLYEFVVRGEGMVTLPEKT